MSIETQTLLTRFGTEGADSYMAEIGMIRKELLALGYAHEGLGEKLKEYTKFIYGVRRAQTAIRTTWRVYHAELMESMRVMRDVGYIGRNIVQMWQAYTIAQMRVADATRNVSSMMVDEVIIQDALTRARQAGDEDRIIDLQIQLGRAHNDVAQAQRDVTKAQRDNIVGYIGIGLQMGDIISRSVTLIYHMNVLLGLRTAEYVALMSTSAAQATLTGITGADTATRILNTLAIKAQTSALATYLALIPGWGWAVLAGAAVAGLGYAATRGGGARGEPKGGTTIHYSPTIYGREAAKSANDDFIDSLRRRGLA